jgi:hypothetical protein
MDVSSFLNWTYSRRTRAFVDTDTGTAAPHTSKFGWLAMTLLVVFAVVLLSVRIAAVLVWLVHHRDNRVLFGVDERKTKVDRQIRTLRVPAQDYLTKDHVPVRVDAVLHFRIVDPVEAPTNAEKYDCAMSQLMQTSLRSVIAKVERDDLLGNGDRFTAENAPIVESTRLGPQDAPPYGPHDEAGNPQDAAVEPHRAAEAGVTVAQIDGLDTPSQRQVAPADIKAEPAVAMGVAMRRGTTNAVRELANGRRMSFVRPGRGDRSKLAAGDRTREQAAAVEKAILEAVPRPDGGPACLGRRGDAGYLRGWDDAVDWISKGNPANAPTWGDVAYMTGWNDASRAIARAGLGAKPTSAA